MSNKSIRSAALGEVEVMDIDYPIEILEIYGAKSWSGLRHKWSERGLAVSNRPWTISSYLAFPGCHTLAYA